MIRSGGMEERRVREGERSSFFFFFAIFSFLVS
jgi:hypothetical protein